MTINLATQNDPFRKYLRNGGSHDMNVNGSGTPVEFEYQVTVESWLNGIQIALQASATSSMIVSPIIGPIRFA